jgi:nanoRNase/pAp phosphatase (c-di-AMP/oligoRNAs hydrolase)
MNENNSVGVKVSELEGELKKYEGQKILIPSRGSPDPDWISSALAHRIIAKRHSIETVIAHIEDISDRENRALTKLIGGGLIQYNAERPNIDFKQFAGFSLVDSQFPDSAFKPHLEGIKCISIIDHHDKAENLMADYIDIDDKAGATATLYTEYIQSLNFLETENEEHKTIATALMHGIRTDTDDLLAARNSRVYEDTNYLSHYIDYGNLRKISLEIFDRQTIEAMFKAYQNMDNRENYVVSTIGILSKRDALWRAAELLLRLPQASTVVVGGIIGDHIDCSLRTYDDSIIPGEFLRKAYPEAEESGEYGGRYDKGGCKIPMSIFGVIEGMSDDDKCYVVDRYLKSKLYSSLGIRDEVSIQNNSI